MFPVLNIQTKGESTTVECTSLDLWIAETLQDGQKSTSEHGTRLIIAYMHVVGREPKHLAEVKTWARDNDVRITLGDPVGPTQTDPGDDLP